MTERDAGSARAGLGRGGLARTGSDSAPVFAVVVMAALIGVRVTTLHDPFPAWDVDPFVTPVPSVALTPFTGMLLDAGIAIAAIVIVLLSARNDAGVARGLLWIAGCVLAGAAVGAVHLFRDGAEHASFVLAWTGAACAGVAGWCLRGARSRTLAIACMLGLAAPVLLKGVLNVAVEHPALMASFDRDREVILQGRGWTEGSAAALQYERRLRQPEATGWFGLSNVFASFAAATAAAGAAGAWIAFRARARAALQCGWVVVGAAGLTGVALSGSKGGAGALVLASSLVIAGVIFERVLQRRRGRDAGHRARSSVLDAVESHAPFDEIQRLLPTASSQQFACCAGDKCRGSRR
ncbi:MAG: hypothetical protein AAF235_07070, partial [Planctomycetota bacterium]